MAHPDAAQLSASPARRAPLSTPEGIVDHLDSRADLIVPLANGEPVSLLDAIEANADRFDGLRIHQMHAIHDRPYLHGAYGDRIRHVSYFLSPVTRPCYAAGHIDLVPSNFSEMRDLLRATTRDPVVLAAASPIDRHGYFSLGVSADYVASFIGRARFFLEVNHQMPRSFGRNQLHVSQVEGWVEVDRPLVEIVPAPSDRIDDRIAALVAERIPDGATIQIGIGATPNAIMAALDGHRDLGIHTELLSDGVVDLIEAGVVNGVRKHINRTKTVGTFALGTNRLHRLLGRQPCARALARQLCQRPTCDRHRTRLRLDQLDTDGRPHRPVRLRDDRRALLLVERWPGRLRTRRDVLQRRTRLRRAPLDDRRRQHLQDQPDPRRRRRRHHAQEHGRQGRHRVGCRRAPRPIDPRAGAATDRDRTSGPS